MSDGVARATKVTAPDEGRQVWPLGAQFKKPCEGTLPTPSASATGRICQLRNASKRTMPPKLLNTEAVLNQEILPVECHQASGQGVSTAPLFINAVNWRLSPCDENIGPGLFENGQQYKSTLFLMENSSC